jgi:hypothetical protein
VRIQGVAGVTDGDYPAARGSETVAVSSSPVSVSIDLHVGVDAGQGLFSYDIALPGGLDSATLEILPLEGGTPVETVDLKTAASGSFVLGSGYYLLKISRVKGGNTMVRGEVVHIYEGWATEAAGPGYDFTGVVSVNNTTELLDALNDKPANTVITPYTVILSGGFDLGSGFMKGEDPLGLLYEALSGKYVNLDLSACTGDIPYTSSSIAGNRPNRDKIVALTLPDSLTFIESYAFYGCSSLASIDLPESLTFIGHDAFRDCSSLASIDLPDSLTSIGDGGFQDCISLAAIDLPNSIYSIGHRIFKGCSSLASIDFPDSLKYLGSEAFYDCSSLESIDLPDSIIFIGTQDFQGCTSLVSIYLPDSLTSIGRDAFSG